MPLAKTIMEGKWKAVRKHTLLPPYLKWFFGVWATITPMAIILGKMAAWVSHRA